MDGQHVTDPRDIIPTGYTRVTIDRIMDDGSLSTYMTNFPTVELFGSDSDVVGAAVSTMLEALAEEIAADEVDDSAKESE